MHISLAAETLITVWGFPLTNSMLHAVLVALALMGIGILIRLTNYSLSSRFYVAVEWAVEGMESLVNGVVTNARVATRVLPYAGTIFVFILLTNWTGIMPLVGSVGFTEPAEPQATDELHTASSTPPEAQSPGSDPATAATHEAATVEHGATAETAGLEAVPAAEHGATAEAGAHAAPKFIPLFRSAYSDLNMTLAIALLSMILVQVFGFQALGVKYLGKFFTLKNPIMTFVGLLELLSEFVKIFSFSFRLFGNIFAGEVLLTVIGFLMPFLGPIPFLGIELFAGAIQALIFTMLTLVFIAGAATGHDDHDDHHAPTALHPSHAT